MNNVLIDAYIGKNADKLKNNKFSVWTLLFGPFYLLYRKVWSVGLVWLGILLILVNFLSIWTILFLIIGNAILAIYFNREYVKYVEKKVDKLKLQNADKSYEQLKGLCGMMGGTSIVAVVVAVSFSLLLLTSSLYFQNTSHEKTKDKESAMKKPEKLSGMDIEIPDVFVASEYNSIYHNSYSYSTDTDYCSITLANTDAHYYESVQVYLEGNIYFEDGDNVSDMEEKKINNQTWYTKSVQNERGTTYYYASSKKDKIYNIELRIYQDGSKVCAGYLESALNSVKLK